MISQSAKVRRLFSQATILAGSPCSGKSTLAARLAEEFRLPFYKVDDRQQDHIERCNPEQYPVMHRYTQMSWDEIWMRPVPEQVAEEFAYFRERFGMILHDLESFDTKGPLVMEGAAFLPELLAQSGADPRRVLVLAPTLAFQRRHYAQRPWIHGILHACRDPEQAFANWMERDHQFGQRVLSQARALNYATLLVDGQLSLDEQYEYVKAFFGFGTS